MVGCTCVVRSEIERSAYAAIARDDSKTFSQVLGPTPGKEVQKYLLEYFLRRAAKEGALECLQMLIEDVSVVNAIKPEEHTFYFDCPAYSVINQAAENGQLWCVVLIWRHAILRSHIEMLANRSDITYGADHARNELKAGYEEARNAGASTLRENLVSIYRNAGFVLGQHEIHGAALLIPIKSRRAAFTIAPQLALDDFEISGVEWET